MVLEDILDFIITNSVCNLIYFEQKFMRSFFIYFISKRDIPKPKFDVNFWYCRAKTFLKNNFAKIKKKIFSKFYTCLFDNILKLVCCINFCENLSKFVVNKFFGKIKKS